MKAFKEKIRDLFDDYEKLVTRKNIPVEGGNGIFTRYQYPVLILLCFGAMTWTKRQILS